MRAAVFEGNGRVAIYGETGSEGVSGRTMSSSESQQRSCGSDLRALATPPEMLYDEGVVLGHEFSGTIADVGDEVAARVGLTCVLSTRTFVSDLLPYAGFGHESLRDRFVHIGSMRDGGAAGLCVVPERMVLPRAA